MIIERPFETGQSRRRIWCKLSDITLEQEGVYSWTNLPDEAVGDGSEVIVMDSPGKLLFYSASDNLLYDWSL